MKSIIDEESLRKCLQKIELYKKEEKIKFMNINNLYIQDRNNYETSNTDKIVEKKEEISNRFITIERLHDQETKTITDNIEKYNTLKVETEKKFDNLI